MPNYSPFFTSPKVNALTLFSVFLLTVLAWFMITLNDSKGVLPLSLSSHIHFCTRQEIHHPSLPFLRTLHDGITVFIIGLSLGTALNHVSDFFGTGVRLRYQVAIVAETMFISTLLFYCLLALTDLPLYICYSNNSPPSTVVVDFPASYKYDYPRASLSVIRYLYWLGTSPPMVSMQSYISSLSSKSTVIGILLEIGVIGFGFLASLCFVFSPYDILNPFHHVAPLSIIITIGWISLILSCICFTGVIYYLVQGSNSMPDPTVHKNFIRRNTGTTSSPRSTTSHSNNDIRIVNDNSALSTLLSSERPALSSPVSSVRIGVGSYLRSFLSTISIILWFCFPLIWFLGTLFIISTTTESILFSITDAFTKIMFTILWLTADCTRMDALVLEQLDEINYRKEEVYTLDRSRKNLLLYIVHELRTPLSTIYLGLEELLRNTETIPLSTTETTQSKYPITNSSPKGTGPITAASVIPVPTHESTEENKEITLPSFAATKEKVVTPTITAIPTIETSASIVQLQPSLFSSPSTSVDTLVTPQRLILSLLNNITTVQSFVNDLLSLERIQAGKLDLVKTEFSVDALLNEVETLFLGPLAAKEIIFEKSIILLPIHSVNSPLPASSSPLATSTPSNVSLSSNNVSFNSWTMMNIVKPYIQVYGDMNKIRHVICNLLSNSIKFTPEGGRISIGIWIPVSSIDPQLSLMKPIINVPTVTSSLPPRVPIIVIRNIRNPVHENSLFPVASALYYDMERCFNELSPLNSDWYRITVSDNGGGIKDEDIPKLFKPFSQINPVLLQAGQGSGLGLSICKQIIKLSGGIIDVRSKVNHGSMFYADLPLSGQPSSSLSLTSELSPLPRTTENQAPSNSEEIPITNLSRNIVSRNIEQKDNTLSSSALLSLAKQQSSSLSSTNPSPVVDSRNSLSLLSSVAIVDDSESNRILLGHLLQHHGVQHIYYGDDGTDILSQLEKDINSSTNEDTLRMSTTVQVWFIDRHMPNMDGLTCIHQLRQRYHITAPCILVTGDPTESEEEVKEDIGIHNDEEGTTDESTQLLPHDLEGYVRSSRSTVVVPSNLSHRKDVTAVLTKPLSTVQVLKTLQRVGYTWKEDILKH